MSYSADISTANTTRLRTLQSSTSVVTTASVGSSPPRHLSNNINLYEMAKKTEIEPLLSTSSTEAQYTSNKPIDNMNSNKSVHEESCLSLTQGDEESLHSYRDEDRLLTPDKPVIVRTYVRNVYLLNFLAFLFVFVNMTFNLTVLAIIHERVPMNEPHLPDVAFDILPDERNFLDITEYFIVFQSTCIGLLLFFHKHRSVIFRRICLIMGLIYFFRAVCMGSTQLPLASRNYECSPQLSNSTDAINITSLEFVQIIVSRVFYMSLGMGLSINGRHSYCGDYIFSGHSVIIILSYLTFQEYLLPPRRKTIFWKIIHIVELGMSIFSIICVIIARGHYSIDIIVAYFVTTNLFWSYHLLCNNSLSSFKVNYFTRVWWWPIFVYFENVKIPLGNGNIKNEDTNQVSRKFEWPLPWPKRLSRRRHRDPFNA